MKPVALALIAALAIMSAGCSKSSTAKNAVVVTATDRECTPARTTLPVGKTTFRVTNNGSKVTEVYVYASGDRVVGEEENIGPQTSRNLSVDLKAGDYELACKPGMTGSGIRAPLTVSTTATTAGGGY